MANAKVNKNMERYNKVSTPPANAVVPIRGGDLGAAGLSSIKVQWRIEAMTSVYGEYGSGWKIDDIEREFVDYPEMGLKDVIFNLNVYVKDGEEWGAPAPGFGQCGMVVRRKSGLYRDAEAIKKAFSDALGNALKYYGVGADVYMGKSAEEFSKYDEYPAQEVTFPEPMPVKKEFPPALEPIAPKLGDDDPVTEEQAKHFADVLVRNGKTVEAFLAYLEKEDITQVTYKEYADNIERLAKAGAK